MSEFNSWTEINWYSLGSILIQIAFLVAGVWFARNFLRIVRAFQEQVGALLKLSITSDPHSTEAYTSRHSADLRRYWLFPTDTPASGPFKPAETRPGRIEVAWHRLVLWLQEPMHIAEVSAWRRFVSWMQAPSGS